MKTFFLGLILLLGCLHFQTVQAQPKSAHNPIIYADVPDMSMIRVGDKYYMSSTTMHMNPGVPIMKSKDLVNWEIVSYAYDTLGNMDELNLVNGKSCYGRGTWASCIRYHNNTYYVSTFSSTTGKTYILLLRILKKGIGNELNLVQVFMIIHFGSMMMGKYILSGV